MGGGVTEGGSTHPALYSLIIMTITLPYYHYYSLLFPIIPPPPGGGGCCSAGGHGHMLPPGAAPPGSGFGGGGVVFGFRPPLFAVSVWFLHKQPPLRGVEGSPLAFPLCLRCVMLTLGIKVFLHVLWTCWKSHPSYTPNVKRDKKTCNKTPQQ